MDKDTLFHLIKKIITGTASKAEEKQVNENLFDTFSSEKWNEEEMGEKHDMRARILKSVKVNSTPVHAGGKVRLLISRLGKVAAVISICSLIGFYGLRFFKNDTESTTSSIQRLQPGKEIASLELEDGTILNLEDLPIGDAFENANFQVIKTKEGNLEYHYFENSEPSKEEWNTLRTPKGGKFQIILADGTKAWLNAESSLTFPKRFAGGLRKVSVTGEVYFEVSHDKEKPFLVNTKEMDIRVLGTSFNVVTYEDDQGPSVSLVEGAVQVKTEMGISDLIPGQQARILDNKIMIGTFDSESEVAWKNDYFIFKNKNIKDIMSELARWYDAEVEYQGKEWEDKNYTIRISRRENIEEILSIIELTESVKFQIIGRRIIVIN